MGGIEPIISSVRMEKEILINAIEEIKKKGKIWRRTGGTHSSLICTKEGDIVSFCEDVSMENLCQEIRIFESCNRRCCVFSVETNMKNKWRVYILIKLAYNQDRNGKNTG